MPHLLNQLKSKTHLSPQQEAKLLGIIGSVGLTVVLPAAVLCLVVRNYYWQLIAVVVVINLVARYGRRFLMWASATKKRREAEKVAQTEKRHEQMIYYVEPSAFTRRYSRFDDDDLLGKTLADDTQHWIVAIRLFFNPYSERRGGSSKNAFYSVAPLVVGLTWVSGWILVVILTMLLTSSSKLPSWPGHFMSGAGTVLIAGWLIMGLWTVAWVMWVWYLWPRERQTITTGFYADTSRRLPFQPAQDRSGESKELQSVVLTITFPGRLLGYGHIQFQTWQSPEPIAEWRFVAHPERIKVILDMLAKRKTNTTKPPPMQHAG